MKNNIVKEDMICPATGKHCDDECCPVGSKCNLSSDGKISDPNISKWQKVVDELGLNGLLNEDIAKLYESEKSWVMTIENKGIISDVQPEELDSIEWAKVDYPFSPEDEAMLDQCYAEINKHEIEILEHNEFLILSKGQQFVDDYLVLIDDCFITNKIEIVDKPEGDDQEEEDGYKSFSKIYVQQWNAGLEDSYEGFIFAEMLDGKWLKIPYSC